MTHIGVTGHQNIPRTAIKYVRLGIRRILEEYDDVVGYTSLAAGADQLFARELLSAGGRLHVVIPAADYAGTLDGDDAAAFTRLLAAAADTAQLPHANSSEAAYYTAGRWIVDHSDLLIAIWDGQPARGLGGTADVVGYARDLAREIRIVWPAGLARE